ncbi:MAG: non-ribosomal peptide synthetase [Minicystis sp.]
MSERCIHDLIAAQARRHPDRVAVRDAGRSFTYAELDRRSNRLARVLQSEGVKPEDTVALCTDRGIEMVVAVIAVLKAGGAYVPLDGALPKDRISFMIENSRSRLLLTQKPIWDELPSHDARPLFVDDPALTEGVSDVPLGPSATPESLAYIYYTSGSTGQPKGIEMVHREIVNLMDYQCSAFTARPDARTAQYSAFFFDASVQDIFAPLVAGGTLVLVPEPLRRDFRGLCQLLADEKVERIFFPVVALNELAHAVGEGAAFPAHLREVIVAGEQLKISDTIRALFDKLGPDSVLHNQYGPVEAHIVTAYALRHPTSAWPALPPIGRPIRGIGIYLLDEDKQHVQSGKVGEVYLGGGVGVARGYRGRPDLTAERFLPDPFMALPGVKMYKTGDLAEIDAQGELQFRGRADFQMKIQGHRVEPEEVETVLAGAPGVKHAAVVGRNAGQTGLQLVAFFLASTPNAAADQVRAYAHAKLPKHMVPSLFIAADSLPMTPSGKLDRKALTERAAELAADTRPELDAAYAPPVTQTEKVLISIVEEALGLDRVGLDDDFFDLGGHSLLAMRIIGRVKDVLGVESTIQAFYEASTVRGFIAVLSSHGNVAESAESALSRPVAMRAEE